MSATLRDRLPDWLRRALAPLAIPDHAWVAFDREGALFVGAPEILLRLPDDFDGSGFRPWAPPPSRARRVIDRVHAYHDDAPCCAEWPEARRDEPLIGMMTDSRVTWFQERFVLAAEQPWSGGRLAWTIRDGAHLCYAELACDGRVVAAIAPMTRGES